MSAEPIGPGQLLPHSGLTELRVPFPAHQVSKLPKPVKSKDQDKGRCVKGSRYSADGHFCGGWHARSIHLDYVGHAALTDRLLDADPEWSWEPVAFGEDGLPRLDRHGGLWIRLTVCGVTRLGYGDAQEKTGPNAVKEAIGDALRNAAMRFGAALELWHKGELHADAGADAEPPEPGAAAEDAQSAELFMELSELITGVSTPEELAAVGQRIAASGLSGEGREQLRVQYSAKSKEVAA